MASKKRLEAALNKIQKWMRENGAPLLADNLAPGATAAQLAKAEATFGFTLPEEDSPPVKLLAPSVTEWAQQYAAQIDAGDYAVEDGFGDYHLSLRNREVERREQKAAQRKEKERQ